MTQALSMMIRDRSHLTRVCDHAEDAWCDHCEFGCVTCGALEGVGDSGRCEECSFEHAVCVAEAWAEGDR